MASQPFVQILLMEQLGEIGRRMQMLLELALNAQSAYDPRMPTRARRCLRNDGPNRNDLKARVGAQPSPSRFTLSQQ